MRTWLFFLSLFSISFLIPAKALAAGEFATTLQSTYQVTDTTTHVSQTFHLKNNFSTMYVTEYALEVGSNRISNVKTVTSTNAPVTTQTTPHGNKTSISIQFSDKIIGKDSTREFTVSYDSPDIGIHTGSVLEVNISKLANPGEFSQYSAKILVPSSYGAPAFATPTRFTSGTEAGQTAVTFTNIGQATGISVLFGKQQIAQFALSYHIENPTGHRGLVTIALPPDSTYQRVYYSSIDPQPEEIHDDVDGNWLATYVLDPGAKQIVKAVGSAVITLTPQEHADQLTKRPGNEYTSSAPYWQVSDPAIQKLAKELKTPKAIFDYVVKTLTYDYTRLNGGNKRLGASDILKNPTSAVCTEFTDLLITLARAAGIPAREINGFAYTQNGTLRPLSLVRDILHAWPEYWDQTTSRWVAVDPTWENTTGGVDYFTHLDFNHIVFAIHGINSETPYPAGEYKFAGEETKDIAISFGKDIPTSTDLIGAGAILRPTFLPEATSPYAVRFTNNSLHAVYNFPYTVHIVNNNQEIKVIPGTISLLPLSSKEVSIDVPNSNLFATQNVLIQTQINGQVFTDTINVKSFIIQHIRFFAISALVGGTALIIAILTWRLLVPRKKR